MPIMLKQKWMESNETYLWNRLICYNLDTQGMFTWNHFSIRPDHIVLDVGSFDLIRKTHYQQHVTLTLNKMALLLLLTISTLAVAFLLSNSFRLSSVQLSLYSSNLNLTSFGGFKVTNLVQFSGAGAVINFWYLLK